MKLIRKLGTALSFATMAAIFFVGFTEISRARAEQAQMKLDAERVELEIEAQRIVAEIGEAQLQCLAKNIFFEARSEGISGQVAVAWVTLNRVNAENYPDSICGVVHQGRKDASGNMIRNKCQFSWYCDGKGDTIPSNSIAQKAWSNAQMVAHVVLLDWARGRSGTVHGATMYHANYVNPKWTKAYDRVAVVGNHIFYR